MGYIRTKAVDQSGNEIEVRYEALVDEQGQRAVAYLKPSGKTYINPMYEHVGSRRDVHLGFDGKGAEYVSDQRWIFDLQEAAELQKSDPDRLVMVEG